MIISVVRDAISLLKKEDGTKLWQGFALLHRDGTTQDSLHVRCSLKIRSSTGKTVTEIFSRFLSLASTNENQSGAW